MLLQTNSYIVPKEKRAEHSRLIRRFRQTLLRLGCDHFEVYEQVGSNWSNAESAGRYVQILRFLDRKHQLAVQAAERTDPTAQAVIADFCDLINFPYQQQQGLFAVGFYTSVLPVAPKRGARGELVSTVEHEVIDDPDAEKPYPGASDGPPLDENSSEQPLPAEEDAIAPEVVSAEPVDHETHEVRAVVEPEIPEPSGSAADSTSHSEGPTTTHPDNDLMSLASDEIVTEEPHAMNVEHVFADESGDDRAHGFIEVENVDEDGGEHLHGAPDAEPAHHLSKDRPAGW